MSADRGRGVLRHMCVCSDCFACELRKLRARTNVRRAYKRAVNAQKRDERKTQRRAR